LKVNIIVLIITLQLSRIMYFGNRISACFSIVNISLIGKLPCITRTIREKIRVIFITIGILLFYWIYIYAISGDGQTFPYISFWS